MSLENAFETGRLYLPLKRIADGQRDILGAFMAIPGIRCFWPMSALAGNGDCLDLVQGPGFQLTLNGGPQYGYTGLAPTVSFNGSTDYFSHLDASVYDITGLETFVTSAQRGLTLGGWFRFSALGPAMALISKWGNSGNTSYILLKSNTDNINFVASQDGTATSTLTGPVAVASKWYFVVATFEPGIELRAYINGVLYTQAMGLTSLFNGSSELRIGEDNSSVARPLNGYASFAFLASTNVSVLLADNLFQLTRDFFGV